MNMSHNSNDVALCHKLCMPMMHTSYTAPCIYTAPCSIMPKPRWGEWPGTSKDTLLGPGPLLSYGVPEPCCIARGILPWVDPLLTSAVPATHSADLASYCSAVQLVWAGRIFVQTCYQIYFYNSNDSYFSWQWKEGEIVGGLLTG